MSDQDLGRQTFPWLRSGFDLEGYVGALAAWLVGILLGLLWGPLFWIGFVGAIVIMLGTRTARRTPPIGEDLIVAPCDGIVVSVGGATPPDELRLDGAGWTRVRVSVGPMCTNGVYAPMDGAIDHIIRESGDPAAFAATKPDRPGLAVAYVALESGDRALGFRLATGGLGPRLEISSELGDAVRTGRNIGTLRLGGWCDTYVPEGMAVTIAPGQTVIGSETVLAKFSEVDTVSEADPVDDEGRDIEPEPAPTVELEDEPHVPELDPSEPDEELTLERVADAETTVEAEAEAEAEVEVEDDDDEEDVAEMFARLRKEARKATDEGDI